MRLTYRYCAALIIAVLLCVAVFSLYAFWDRDNLVSERENRTLHPFPPFTAETWFHGSFSLGLEAYLSDHVLLRDELIPVTRTLERWMRAQSKIRIVDITKPN